MAPKSEGNESRAGRWIRTTWTLWEHYLFETWTQMRRHKASYLLGFFACLVVVVVVACLLTVIGHAPIVYMRIAELESAEIDVRLTPSDDSSDSFLNYTTVASTLTSEMHSYHSPRWEFDGVILHRCSNHHNRADGGFNGSIASVRGATWPYHGYPLPGTEEEDCAPYASCFAKYCGSVGRNTSTSMVAANSKRERRMILGRTWTLRDLERDEVHISEQAAKKLGVSVGDVVVAQVPPTLNRLWSLWSLAHSASNGVTAQNSADWKQTQVYAALRVAGIYESAMGRVPSNMDTGAIVEFDHTAALLSESIDPTDRRPKAWFARANLSHYADQVLVNLPPPRSTPYVDSDMDAVRKTVTAYASEIVYRVGFNNVNVDLPVMTTLYPYRFVGLFLGLIINLSIVVLLFLCIILIYSLLMINVETRSFEVGVFRMIGSSRPGLVAMLLTQSLSYAVPSWAIGLGVAQALAVLVFYIIEKIASVPIPNLLTGTAIGVATALGFGIPLAASILPIRKALSQNLSESLDTRRSKTQAVQIKIERSEQNKINWSVFLVGLFLALFGFGTYYIFPISLLTFNFNLLLNLFFALILLMLVGFVMLSLNLENITQQFLALLFFFWDKLAIRKILLKNLVAHRLRNRKTTVMYSVALSFIIFMYVAYAMQTLSFEYESKQARGSELGLSVGGIKSNGYPYTITHVAELERFAKSEPLVDSFAWSTVDLSVLTGSAFTATNIGRTMKNTIHVYGISPNFYSMAFPEFLAYGGRIIDESLNPNITLSEQLYSLQGSKGLVLGSFFKTSLGLQPGDHFLVNENIGGNLGDIQTTLFETSATVSSNSNPPPIRKKTFAFLNVATAFKFSKFPSATEQDALVSFPHFIALSRGKVKSMEAIPLAKFYVKLVRDVDKKDYDRIKQTLMDIAALEPDRVPDVWDLRRTISSMDVSTKITNYFFLFTTLIAMVTSFFSLSSSMLANVFEQTKEIGVLRALGIKKRWMRRIYVYEAFIVVFGSSIMGIIIGVIIGWTMTLQRVLFTQLPLGFVFPWQILLLVFGLSVVFALLSSLGPVASLMSQPIVQIMRTLS